MKPSVSKLFRSIQIYFPFLQDYRFEVQRTIRKLLNYTHEEDFEILPFLPPSKHNLFVDIGANRGDAIQSILMRRPDTSVVAFEPNTFLVSKLKRLYANEPRVRIQDCGLGKEDNKFDLYIPFYNKYMFDGLASFKEQNARDWLRGRLYGFSEEKLEVKKMTCSVKRLDDFSLRPCFIKIDVQGFEYEVLLGAKRTIEESRPIVLMESPGKNELEFLVTAGYQPFMYKNRQLIPGTKNYNIFFIPGEIASEVQRNIQLSTQVKSAA
jgi:FkbM family methyltransferase